MGEEPTGEVLTAGEVAQWLDWRPNSVYIAARAGRLPAGRVGAQWRRPSNSDDTPRTSAKRAG